MFKRTWTIEAGWFRRRGGAAAALALSAALSAAPAGAGDAAGDAVVSRFRIGPFFEYRATERGGTFWAVRPFFSRLSDPVSDTDITDVAWPLCTRHRAREKSWWRAGLAYGSNDDVRDAASGWSAALFPLYFQGRTRGGEDYRALFPLYGHLPHVLLMDDVDFALFPLYLDYEVNRVERRYYLWPVFSRRDNRAGETTTGVFPFYGETRREGGRSRYAFWPFWNDAVHEGGKNPGRSWMLWPVCGRVDRRLERQTLVLPPFFSHAETDGSERWRLPWPFYETLKSADETKRSYWPFFGDVRREDERRWYAAWPLAAAFSLETKGRVTERSRFFPFYMSQAVYDKGKDGSRALRESYTRVWPFFSWERRGADASRLRVLELSPVRLSGGIERNWAPFWTLYERTGDGRGAAHDALWGLVKFRTGEEKEEEGPGEKEAGKEKKAAGSEAGEKEKGPGEKGGGGAS